MDPLLTLLSLQSIQNLIKIKNRNPNFNPQLRNEPWQPDRSRPGYPHRWERVLGDDLGSWFSDACGSAFSVYALLHWGLRAESLGMCFLVQVWA